MTEKKIIFDDKAQGQVRHILTSVGGLLVSWGILEESVIEPLVGAAMVIVGMAWSWKSK